MASPASHRITFVNMNLLFLEALAALVLLVFIVWWTMFSGRKGGELHDPESGHGARPDDPPRE